MKLQKMLWTAGLALIAGGMAADAQVNSMSGVGGNTLYGRGPVGTGDLGLDEGIKERDHLSVGPFTVHPRIELLAIKEDNVFLSDQEPVDDSYLVLSPGLLARIGETKDKYVYVDGSIDVPVSYDEDSEDFDNIQLTALGHYKESKSTVNAWYRFRDLRAGDIIIGNRVTKEEHVLYGGYDHSLSSKTALGVNATYSQHDFASEDYTDYSDLKLSGRVYWKAFDKTRLFAQLSLGDVDVDGRVDQFGDAEYIEGSLGLDTELSSRWHASGNIGYQIREFDRDDIDDVEGITSALRLEGLLFDHFKAGVGFWSMIQPAVNEAGATLTEMRIEPTLSRRLWIDELVASASVVWGQVDYESPDNQVAVGELETPLVFNDREDDYFGYTFGLDWQVLRQFVLGAGYSYIENDTNSSVGDESTAYEAERWLLRAQYNF